MENNIPDVSFITVNYNGLGDTLCLIKSIRQIIKSVSYEIIVVDNASKNNEYLKLNEEISQFPNSNNIVCIESKKNLGFAGGNNLGIKKAIGKYLFFVNNDTFFTSDNITELTSLLEKDKKNGGVSPKILYPKDKEEDTILFAGFTPLSKITLRNSIIDYGKKNKEIIQQNKVSVKYNKEIFSQNKEIITPYLHGAAMMIKRQVIEQVGTMPEDFFLYYEELDWSLMIRRAGFLLYYQPSCVIYHNESQATGKNSPMQVFYQTRNRLLLAKRNLNGCDKTLSILYQIFIADLFHCLKYLVSGKQKHAHAITKGIISFLNYKPIKSC